MEMAVRHEGLSTLCTGSACVKVCAVRAVWSGERQVLDLGFGDHRKGGM